MVNPAHFPSCSDYYGQRGPEKPRAELLSRDGVGGDSGRAVVGGSRDHTGTWHR
jgi:hypothetical protein